MDYHEFLHEVEVSVRKKIRNGSKVVINAIVKNNDQKLDAISIMKDSQSIVPNVYVNRYFDNFQRGLMSIEDIATEIVRLHTENKCPHDYIMDINDFNNISERIVFRLVNQSLNSERLKGMPNVQIEDLAKV